MSTMTERTAGETFAHLIRLHLDNDEGTYNARREVVAEAIENTEASGFVAEALGSERRAYEMARRADVADALKEFVEELVYGADWETNSVSLLAMDVIGAALGYVDWFDMADDYIAEHDEEASR